MQYGEVTKSGIYVSLSVPLLRAKGAEEEAEVGLEATEKGCAPKIKGVVLPLPPDEALVVDVTRGLNGGDMIKRADRILVKTASCVGDHWEESNVKALAYIVYWNSYAVAMCNARLRIPLPPHERRRLGGREA